MSVSGTEGYADEAPSLFERYDSLAFVDVHRRVLHLMPDSPGGVVDIGAGTGRDAAYLAAMGHRVVAVEPTRELRRPGMALHASPLTTWIGRASPWSRRRIGPR